MRYSIFNRIKQIGSLLLLALFLLPSRALAVEETQVQDLRGTNIVNGASITTADPVFGSAGWSNQTAYSVSNIVYFEIDFNNQANKFFYASPFSATVNVDIDVYNDPFNPTSVSNTYSGVNLEVNYNPVAGTVYKGLASYKFNGAYKVVVRLNSDIVGTGINPVDYPIFKLTNQLTVTRQYNFVDVSSDVTQYSTDGKKLDIYWTPTNYKGAEMFDVEWTFVDEYSAAGQILLGLSGTIPASQLEPHFRNNSGRSTVVGNTYQFNLNYNSGFLLYRIRGVQYRITDGIRMEGNWNYSGSIMAGSQPNPYSCAVARVIWHEKDLNWQYQAAFAEDGKKKEIINYFDGSQRSRQTVTLNNSDNVSVVAEPVYDAQGRAAMNILPAPVADNELKYYRLFNLNNNNKPVSHLDIPIANCGVIAAPLNPASGVEKYFSPNNTFQGNPNQPWHEAIPNANGFPFSVTQYTSDNTGRIRAQGSVGDTFQLGTDHETKYFYGKPTQYELDRLFGADAGEHNHYLKNMVVDPNGQVSVSYVNSAGKTIATGLAGVVPENLEGLSSATPPTNTVHDVILTPSSFQINNANKSLEATTTLLVSSSGDYKFTYKFTPEIYKEAYNGGQDTLCYTCVYDMLITVKTECGDVLASKSLSGVPLFDTTCTPPAPIQDTFSVTFYKVGEYSVYFELKVNEEALDSATQHYLANNTDILTLNHFLLEQLIEENLAECYSDCDACKALPETLDEFILKVKAFYDREGLPFNAPEITFATNLYDTIKYNCITHFSNCVSNPCDDILEVLKADVTPGGQYAEFDVDYNLIDPAINVLVHYTQVVFTDENGQPASVENENGDMVPPSSLSLKEFIEKFEDSWADSLVKFHPEFCYYEWCTKNAASQSFNQRIEDLVSAEEAIDEGLFDRTNPLTLLNADPFFATGGYGFPYRTQMQNDLNLYSQNVLNISEPPVKNIFETIDYLLYCGPVTPTISWANCQKAPNDPCRSMYKEWLLFSEWYLDRKHKYYTAALKANNPDCINCFIPSSAPIDPNVIAGCVAPSISSFSVDSIPGSSVDGLKRIRITYMSGNQTPQWPLNVQVTMSSSTTNLTVTQSIIFVPGFGSQEMIVQDEFDSFSITGVACAQLTDGSNRPGQQRGTNAKTARKSVNERTRVFKKLERVVEQRNRLLRSGTPVESVNPMSGKQMRGWECPKIEDFSIDGIETSTLRVCYNGTPIADGHSVSLWIRVNLYCGNELEVRELQLDFCSGSSNCKDFNFGTNCTVVSVDQVDLRCDEAPCGENWSCPRGAESFTLSYNELSNGNWQTTLCYLGPSIPAGIKVIVYVAVDTDCGSTMLIPFEFCSETGNCVTKILNGEEICRGIKRAYVKEVVCEEGECRFECPTEPDNFIVTFYQVNNGNGWQASICYTGAPIPANHSVILDLYIKTECGEFDRQITFCAGAPACQLINFSNEDVCDRIIDIKVRRATCINEPCRWECPEDPSNFSFDVTTLPNGDFQIKTCYTGAPIPSGTRVVVTVNYIDACGNEISYQAIFCENTSNCHIQHVSREEACGNIRSVKVNKIKCDTEACEWECPTNANNYTFSVQELSNGDFEIRTCYIGAPIPAGKRVIVTVSYENGCGNGESYQVIFCSGSSTCHTKIISAEEACREIRLVRVKDVKCDEEPCKVHCPTEPENYSLTYQQLPNGNFEIRTCYTGMPIPAGKRVVITVNYQTDCGTIISYQVTFCANTSTCHTRIVTNQEACGGIKTLTLKDVKCDSEPCSWSCPTSPANYTVNYQQDTNGDFIVTTCYTGAPIPAGKRVLVTVAVLTDCGTTITYQVTFCANTPTCHTRLITNADACRGIRSAGIKDVKCDEEPCVWECPTSTSNYTVSVQQNVAGDFVITTCYTGAPIPAGKRVIVTVAVLTDCGTTISYQVTFCANTPTCHTRIITNAEACRGIRSAGIKNVKCDDKPCAWECPTSTSNYTVSVQQNVGGDFIITTCYTGAPIPAGKRVVVTVSVLTDCGTSINYQVTFCANSPTCHARIITNADACRGIRSAVISDVKCDDEPCGWQCPTNPSNYSLSYVQLPNGNFQVTTCYTGPQIPAGNRVLVTVRVQTGCGTFITFPVIFCPDSISCKTRIIPAQLVCGSIAAVSIQHVTCDQAPCNWECPTNPSNYSLSYQPVPGGGYNVTACYLGAAIPPGNKVTVVVQVNTNCNTSVLLTYNFCSTTALCQTKFISANQVCSNGIDTVFVKNVVCSTDSCGWECPVDPSNYNITKTYKVLKSSWEVKICYTGPAIPFNKTVIVPVTITSPCSNTPVTYNIRFCQAITCHTYIVPNALACAGNFTVTLGQISCEDSPCSGECPDTSKFTAVVNNQVTCPPVAGYNVKNIRVTHTQGPLSLQPPMGRVKVTLAITTKRLFFGTFPQTVEKTVTLNTGDTYKDLCFQYALNRVIDTIIVINTECLGPCPTGDCCDDPRYELYAGKDRRFQDYIEPDFNAIMQSYQSGNTNFGGYPINYCKNECEMMADAWVQDLSRCLNANPQRLERVRRGLIDVCQQSCTAQSGNPTIHPFSDLNPAPSFESIITAEFGPITDTCAYDLISDPYPWGKVPIIDRTFATETNTAICNRLDALRTEAASHGYSNDVDGLHDYLTAFYQPYYDLIKEELQDLFTGCIDCNNIMPLPVELPAFMDGNAKPCFTCNQFDGLVQQFNTKYPGVTPATDTYEILFRNFINHQTGYSHGFEHYYDFMEKCSLNVNNYRDTGRICETPQVMEIEIDLIAQCMDEKFQNALSNATNIYNAYIDSVIRAFRNNYTSKCLDAQIWLESDAKLYEYHYTLYYYDQAGNLVKTVPPKGVQYLSPANISLLWANRNNYIVPNHTLATTYEYNSFNQVIKLKTPDAGISEFWYDRLGRLTVSQNSEQKTPANGGSLNRYSYTKYEPILGRILEIGEKTGANSITTIDTRNNVQLLSWLNSGTDTQITETIYDQADPARVANSNITDEQHHFTSRNRVVAALYSKIRYSNPSQYDAATHYSYDINGNAKTIWQENERLKEADPSTEGLKRMDYEFDLVSGKMNKVYYQKNKGDQFIYKYKYDAENRITDALTSRDGILWQTDASYKYYLHGPLARTEIGTHKVQGVDLAYTLQGWMKFMNAPVMNDAADIGRDGNTQIPNNVFSRVSRDAYGYGISYYEGDFKPIGQNSPLNFVENVPGLMGTGKNLFNGNIRATTLQIRHLGDPVSYSYSYDQLNRLVKMRQHLSTYTAPVGSTAAALAIANPTNEYQENIKYDANGNILDYLRNGTTANGNPLEMDDMRYEYYVNTNKLKRVHDAVPSGNYSVDIDQQTNANNYKYDNIGNLISDQAENISGIKWNVSGKISRITKSDANNTVIEFEYDATGSRIYKKVTSAGQEKYTFYIKDAQGNTMALYSRTDVGQVEWGEQHLYGSSRLGMHRIDMPVPTDAPVPAPGATMEDMFEYGRSQYELSNHLGNVLATISDKKVGIELGTTGTVDYFEADVTTANDYYPFGMLMPERSYSQGGQYRYGFQGQEKDDEIKGMGNHYTAQYWEMDPRLGRRWNTDPVVKSHESPYAIFANNPNWFIDPNGADTLDINKNDDGKWVVSKTQIASGDDVFRVKNGDETKTHTFSEGEYGKRFCVLNLENDDTYTLGIYHISGQDGVAATGYVITPGGEASTKVGSGKRLPDDTYTLTATGNGTDQASYKWVQPLVTTGSSGGYVGGRGVKIHPAPSSATETEVGQWTEGCFVVCTDYIKSGTTLKYNSQLSITTSKEINCYFGSTKDYDSIGKKNRQGSDFANGIDFNLIQKTGF